MMTREQFEAACTMLPQEIRRELLTHARVSRSVAMRVLDIDHDATFKKVVDANPNLVHKLPGEQRARYHSVILVALLVGNRCAAQGEGANERSKAEPVLGIGRKRTDEHVSQR